MVFPGSLDFENYAVIGHETPKKLFTQGCDLIFLSLWPSHLYFVSFLLPACRHSSLDHLEKGGKESVLAMTLRNHAVGVSQRAFDHGREELILPHFP
jgi:hypothetical protein